MSVSPKRKIHDGRSHQPPHKRARIDNVAGSNENSSMSIHQLLSQQMAPSFANPFRVDQTIQIQEINCAEPMWLEAQILRCEQDSIFVHFTGFSSQYDCEGILYSVHHIESAKSEFQSSSSNHHHPSSHSLRESQSCGVETVSIASFRRGQSGES